MLRTLQALGSSLAVVAVAGFIVAGSASATPTRAHFKSPSGNIDCYVFSGGGGAAACTVRKAAWPSTPKKPASCTLDWAPNDVQLVGAHVTVGGCRGDVGPLCYVGGDRCSILAYGHGVTIGSIRCSSSTAGVTCRRTTGSRPGFRVARAGVTVYR